MFSTTEKSAFTLSGYSSMGLYLFLCSVQNKILKFEFDKPDNLLYMFCSHGRLFKRAFNQDRAVKRVYTVVV